MPKNSSYRATSMQGMATGSLGNRLWYSTGWTWQMAIGPMEALALVPPEILRYVIARSKIGRHIEFDTGSALFEMADEYERLLSRIDT